MLFCLKAGSSHQFLQHSLPMARRLFFTYVSSALISSGIMICGFPLPLSLSSSYHRIVFQIKKSIWGFFLNLMDFDGILSPKIYYLTNFLAIWNIIYSAEKILMEPTRIIQILKFFRKTLTNATLKLTLINIFWFYL